MPPLVSKSRSTLAQREKLYGPNIVDAFATVGIDTAWALALARIESLFDPQARVETGTDGARGGAYGLFQITRKTARELGMNDSKEYLLTVDGNIDTCVELTQANAGRCVTKEDLYAMHNSGKVFRFAPKKTREQYVPRAMAAYAEYKARIDKGEFLHIVKA